MLARCPNCRAVFNADRTGQQNCPTCGKPLVVPEQPVAAATPVDPNAAAPRFLEPPGDAPKNEPTPGTPWERRPELPMHLAWLETVKLALFEPNKLFSLAQIDKRGEQTSFAVLTYSVFAIIGQLLNRLMMSGQQDRIFAQLREKLGEANVPAWLTAILQNSQHPSFAATLLSLLFAPLVAFIFVYLNAAVTHFFAMIFGQNKKGFDATFTACAYAMAPAVLVAIPACGSLVALVWAIILTAVGLKRTHGITPTGATTVTLGPYILFCCAGCALLAVAITAGAHALSSGLAN